MAAFEIAVGVGGTEEAPDATTASISPGGSDRWVFGIVAAGGFSGTPDVTDMRHGGSGGTPLAQIGSDLTVSARHAVWGLAPGPSGSTTFFGNWDTPLPQSSAVVAACFSGVDQSTPNGTAVTNSGDGETATVRASITVTGVVSGQMVVAGFSAFDFNANIQSFVGANGTTVRASGIGATIPVVGACIATKVASGTSVTLEVDITSNAANFITWGAHAVAINDAAGLSSVTSDRSGTYAVIAPVTGDRAGSYAVIAPVTNDRAGAYAVVAAVTADRSGAFAVVAPVEADRSGTYAVIAPVTADLAGAVGVIAPVTSDRDGTFGVIAPVTADRSGSYTIQSASEVSSDRSGAYAVIAPVAADQAGTFGVSVAVSSDLSGAWAVIAPVTSDRAGAFAVVGGVAADLAGAFAVLAAAERDQAGGFAVLAPVQRDLAGTWSLWASVQRDLLGTFQIGQGAIDLGFDSARLVVRAWVTFFDVEAGEAVVVEAVIG
jgi:hypothetical protein